MGNLIVVILASYTKANKQFIIQWLTNDRCRLELICAMVRQIELSSVYLLDLAFGTVQPLAICAGNVILSLCCWKKY